MGIVHRAFELAPTSQSIEELRRKLVHEGFFQVDAHFSSRTLREALSKRLGHSDQLTTAQRWLSAQQS